MTFTDDLRAELRTAPPPDHGARTLVQARVDDILRPSGALARLDEIAVWIAGWQRSVEPGVSTPQVVVFAGDHGVASAEAVSAVPAEMTSAMLAAFKQQVASVNAMAATVEAGVRAVDVGVGNPTGNLRIEPALDEERFAASFLAGRETVAHLDADLDTDLLIVGEVGIGNTTAAAALTATFLGGDPSEFVGRGTGIDDETLRAKSVVVTDAVHRIRNQNDPMEILREVGGTELVAMAGAIVEARMRSLPMVLDGYAATASALALHTIDPALVEHMMASHRSAEPGHGRALEAMGMRPLLELDLRLGEATGAVLVIPIIKMACHAVTHVATFTEWLDG